MSKFEEMIRRLSAMPLSTEDMSSTWCPPDWEEIKDWWDQYVQEARELLSE